METALLLIAHGSREPDANDDLHYVVTAMRQQGTFAIIEASFLEFARPTIGEGGQRCIEQGAECVVMLPYFLSAGVHVLRDLASARGELATRFAGIEFRLAEPLGRHPRILEIVAARAQAALATTA